MKKPSKILLWYEKTLHLAKPSTFDHVLNAVILASCIAMAVVFAYTYLITQPSIEYINETHCVERQTQDVYNRAMQRMQNRAFEVMETQCSDDDTVITSNQIEINGEPTQAWLAVLCRTGMRMVNPKTIKVGKHHGKCEESFMEKKKQKRRYFPVIANISKDTRHVFVTLEEACEYEHAMERLACKW